MLINLLPKQIWFSYAHRKTYQIVLSCGHVIESCPLRLAVLNVVQLGW